METDTVEKQSTATDEACPVCSTIPVTGITEIQEQQLKGNSYRVYHGGEGGPFTDHKELVMARSSACGHPNAMIHRLLPFSQPPIAITRSRAWEFDSHLTVSSSGRKREVQVWSRPAEPQFGNTRAWTITEDTPGKENPPRPSCGYWTNTDAFKKDFPHFNRADTQD